MLLRHEGFRRLCRARELLLEEREHPLSIKDLASEVGISPFHFIRQFEALFGVANVLEHGNFDAPRRAERALSRVLITPTLHRRHHVARLGELDSNFGTIFSLWDRAARTLRASTRDDRFATGLPGCDEDPRSLAAMLREPLR